MGDAWQLDQPCPECGKREVRQDPVLVGLHWDGTPGKLCDACGWCDLDEEITCGEANSDRQPRVS